MSNFTKLLSLTLVLFLVISLGVTSATAASITINRHSTWDSGATPAKTTYTYYKIFDAEITGSNVVYTVDSEAKATAVENVKVGDSPIFKATKIADDSKYQITLVNMPTSEKNYVDALKTMVESKSTLFPGTSKERETDSITIDVGSDGYYLILASNGQNAAVQTLDDVAITEKNDYPTIDKKQSKTNSGYANDDLSVQVGDYIYYEITVHIPADAVGPIVVVDKMSSGLDYDGMSLALSPSITTATPESTDPGHDAAATWQIKIPDNVVIANRGEDIVITYRAKVTEDALDSSSKENEVKLYYDNGNYVLTDKVEYTTYYTVIEKVDGNNHATKLDGVKFTVTCSDDADFKVGKPSGQEYYIPSTSGNSEVVTNTSGLIIIRGLDNTKTYTLTETQTNSGYNLLTSPIQITADKMQEDKGGTISASSGLIVIENNSGKTLPTTGGIGTTIFYVCGGVLVIAAAAYFLIKRKMDAE